MNREKINYAKSELKNWRYLENSKKGFELKLEAINVKLFNLAAPPINRIPGHPRDYRREELNQAKQMILEDAKSVVIRLKRIKGFMELLSQDEQEIITDLYRENMSYEELSDRLHYSVRQTKRYVDRILDTWQ